MERPATRAMKDSAAACATAGADWVVSRRRGAEALAEVLPEWRRLSLSSGNSPLCGPDWITAYVETHGLSRHVSIWTVRRGGRLVAVAPLLSGWGQIRRIPLRRLSGCAGLLTLRYDLTAEPGAEGEAAVGALWSALAEEKWTYLELQPVAEGGWAERLVEQARAAGFPVCGHLAMRSPLINLAGGFEAALAATKPHFRAKLRRTRRRLEERGRLVLETERGFDAGRLEAFLAMEAAGWKGHARDGRAVLVRAPEQRQFFLRMSEATAAAGQFVLHWLRLDGRPLAASLGLQGRDSYHAVKWCYDEEFASYGPGHLLIEAIARECAERGLREFDFTGPEYDYKRQWTASGRTHRALFVFRPNWRGRGLRWLKMVGRQPEA